MSDLSNEDITGILEAWNLGDVKALPKLVPLLYRELHRLAHSYMAGERIGHTLQTTALIHEAYLRLEKLNKIKWQDSSHFLAISARLMRRILVEAARSRRTEKRGGDRIHVSFSEDLVFLPGLKADMVDLDRALEKLAQIDERKSRVIELRFFGGLKVEETANLLKVSVPTVIRDWNFSKAWILNEIRNC